MGIMKCTTRLLNELGIKPIVIPSQPTGLSDWHANLLRIDRKKCVLFTNDQTLYSFFILLVKKPSLTEFGHLFRLGLLKSLMIEGLDDPHVGRMLSGNGAIEITKTSSRSVLGSMNDLAFQAKYMIHTMGGLANADFSEIGRELNRIPMSAIKYNVAIEELKQKLVEP
jgi:hypothetical protein